MKYFRTDTACQPVPLRHVGGRTLDTFKKIRCDVEVSCWYTSKGAEREEEYVP